MTPKPMYGHGNADGPDQSLSGIIETRIVVAELERQQNGHHLIGGFITLARVAAAGI